MRPRAFRSAGRVSAALLSSALALGPPSVLRTGGRRSGGRRRATAGEGEGDKKGRRGLCEKLGPPKDKSVE